MGNFMIRFFGIFIHKAHYSPRAVDLTPNSRRAYGLHPYGLRTRCLPTVRLLNAVLLYACSEVTVTEQPKIRLFVLVLPVLSAKRLQDQQSASDRYLGT